MNSLAPTAVGFRIVFRQPAIPLAEIAWRWSFAAAAWFLGAMYLLEYADSLPVSKLDRILLGTRQPALVWRAIHRILEGSALRFAETGILLVIALTMAWIALASVGRAATVKALLEELGAAAAGLRRRRVIPSLSALNFLRASVALAALVSCLGGAALASSVWASTRVSAADAARLWFALLSLAWFAWSILNWLLSTASLFVVAGQDGALQAIASTVQLCEKQSGAVLTTGIWFGIAHLGAMVTASVAGFSVLMVSGAVRPRPVLFLELSIVLLYLGVADFLYTGRLAAYAAIIRGEEVLEAESGTGSSPGRAPTEWSGVDKSELILSDVTLPTN